MDELIGRVKRDLKFFPNIKLYHYKDLEEEIPKIYVPVNSNKQISTIYKYYKSDESLFRVYYSSLIVLLTKQYNINEEKIIKLFTKKDKKIYDYLLKNRGPYTYQKIQYKNRLTPQIRKCIVSRYKKKIKNYLDVGCNDGKKTELTGKYLGLNKKDIYCLNLNQDETFVKKHISNNITFNYYNGKEVFPYQDNFFSLVTIDQVLHHAEDVELILKEVFRVLKKDGLLLVRDHDARTDFDKLLCDIEHMYYGNYLENITKIEKTGNYTSWLELNYTITSQGFILKNHLKDSQYKNELHNVTRTYYSLYQKP